MQTKKRGRPPKDNFDGMLYVRCTAEMLNRLDEIAANYATQTGLPVTRSDMARVLLTEAIVARTPSK